MIHFKPFRFGRTELVTVAIIVGLAVLVLCVSTVPVIAHWYERINRIWTDWAIRYGYFGSFLAALVGNLTIVIVFPYTIVTFFLAASGLNPLWIGIITGVGAFLGEMSGYILGRWGSKKFQESKPEAYVALDRIVKARPKFVHWLLFIFSLLPLPDDVLFIPLGMLRYSVWKLAWPSVLGKIGANLIIAYAGTSFMTTFSNQSITSTNSVLSEIGSLVLLTLVMYAILKLDWTKMMHRLIDSHPATRRTNETPV